jgi:hypothetical protein
MLRELAFPQGMESPGAFKWDESFNDRFRELLKQLCWE